MQIDTSRLQLKEIVAYSAWGYDVQLVPAWRKRDWMTATNGRFAYHCLPMTLANESGWFILAPHGAIVEWNGGDEIEDLTVTIVGQPNKVQAMSAVGHGIMTWTIPYLFRTPPGWNMLCRGPSNVIKDGIAPLEGLVETDWSLASFSMNWKMTRPGRITFEEGEPVAMLVPQRRADLEEFTARKENLFTDATLFNGYTTWIEERREFLRLVREGDMEAVKKRFQKHYWSGQTNAGVAFEGHQKQRSLQPFRDAPDAPKSPAAAATAPPAASSGDRPAEAPAVPMGRCPINHGG